MILCPLCFEETDENEMTTIEDEEGSQPCCVYCSSEYWQQREIYEEEYHESLKDAEID